MPTRPQPQAAAAPAEGEWRSFVRLIASLPRRIRDDRGLSVEHWDGRVGPDVGAITRIITATAICAYVFAGWQVVYIEGRDDPFVGYRHGLIALMATSLWWMPRLLAWWRSPLPAALLWGAIPLTSAALDRASGGLLIDVLWSLIPGYLAISVVGFSFGSLGLAAGLGIYCACGAALVYDLPRGVELQVAFLLMMLSTGAYLAHLYRRSVRAGYRVATLQAERVRNLARILPDPIATALHDEAQLRELMRPREREVIAIRIDVRSSTRLLQQSTALGYAAVVRPLTAELYRHARTLNAFAKFEGDGLLVVFGAFDDAPCGAEAAATVIDFLHHADHTADLITTALHKRGLRPLYIGMGVDRGDVVAGTVAGLEEEFLFDVIGEPINRASRLEAWSKTRFHSGPQPRNIAVLSAAVAELCGDTTNLHEVALDGQVRDFEKEPLAFELMLDADHEPMHWSRATAPISGGFDKALASSGAYAATPEPDGA